MATPLSTVFTQLAASYTSRPGMAERLWAQLEGHYGSKSRRYHNLQHLQQLHEQLLPVKEAIDDWDTLLFALFYHDVIYSTTAKDNEEKSAAAAEKALQRVAYPEAKMQRCKSHILATKTHVLSPDADTNYFTDADLSMLGAPWPQYEAYTKAIRKEYALYPDLLYKPGRRKVLQHFLGMETIYKTDHFRNQLETAARENLQQELERLSSPG